MLLFSFAGIAYIISCLSVSVCNKMIFVYCTETVTAHEYWAQQPTYYLTIIFINSNKTFDMFFNGKMVIYICLSLCCHFVSKILIRL